MIPAPIACAMTQQLFTCPLRCRRERASSAGAARLVIRKTQEAVSSPPSPWIPGITPEKATR
jgi:hypothetical protein